MSYRLFLFDLDDTLLDFRASERMSFFSTMQSFGVTASVDALFESYQLENKALWLLFEQAKTTKEHLKVERFRKSLAAHGVDLDPNLASQRYLEALPETVVLMDHAVETCQMLCHRGFEIGIITNGIHRVQIQRIQNSKLAPFISFVSVSEEAGFAKPDVRFFEYTASMVKNFAKNSTLIIGDRLETDIRGANTFGVDACWFNPGSYPNDDAAVRVKYEIQKLSQLADVL